jgi:hypothetical protein
MYAIYILFTADMAFRKYFLFCVCVLVQWLEVDHFPLQVGKDGPVSCNVKEVQLPARRCCRVMKGENSSVVSESQTV